MAGAAAPPPAWVVPLVDAKLAKVFTTVDGGGAQDGTCPVGLEAALATADVAGKALD